MKAVGFALMAMVLFAVSNVLIDRYLRDIPSPIIVAAYYTGNMVLALPFALATQRSLDFRFAGLWLVGFLLLNGVIIFAADICYFRAYNYGGSLFTITMIATVFPVMASIIKLMLEYATTGQFVFPEPRMLLGWLLAASGVALVSLK